MALTNTDIEKIAHLARLGLDVDAIPSLAADLSNIIELVEQMNSVDTTGIEPMAHPMDASASLRPDEVRESNQREAFQAIAPKTADGLYLVPKVIE